MAKEAADTVEQPDYLGLSDEEILKMGAPVAPVVKEAAEEQEEQEEVEEEGDENAETKNSEADSDDEDDADQAADEESVDGEGKDPKKEEKKEGSEKETKPKDEKVPEKKEEKAEKTEVKEEKGPVNYEAEYKRLLAPFKANGREVQVNSVDDAITLMQMGANYNKKMAALKPNLKLMKLLENNGLLSEDKLSFLIELDKKSPEAINKLVKDSGLNPMDIDPDKASEYKPKLHTVDDREMALDGVLDEIQDTASYPRTLAIVSKEWDQASKQTIADHPQLLKLINEHVERGIYDLISKEVDSQRMLGRLNGMSDFEAYRQVGDAIQARGGFNHLGSSQGKTKTENQEVEPKPKKAVDDKLKDKRRAAGSTRTAPSTSATQATFNPLALSDEDFAKQAAPKYR